MLADPTTIRNYKCFHNFFLSFYIFRCFKVFGNNPWFIVFAVFSTNDVQKQCQVRLLNSEKNLEIQSALLVPTLRQFLIKNHFIKKKLSYYFSLVIKFRCFKVFGDNLWQYSRKIACLVVHTFDTSTQSIKENVIAEQLSHSIT